MYNTPDIDILASALVDLIGFFGSPRRLELLLREASVELDRALVAIVVCIAVRGPLSVAAIADELGRDHTTISRQLAKLESRGLVTRQVGGEDRRVRGAGLTPLGEAVAQAIAAARRRLLSRVLADWSKADRAQLAALSLRFSQSLSRAAGAPI